MTSTSQRREPGAGGLVIFDGVCNVCNGAVDFIVRRDPQARFCFAPTQSPLAQALIREHRIASQVDSLVLIRDGRHYLYSSAALEIARDLDSPCRHLYALRFVPRWIRDGLYRGFARHRYRLFGRRAQCRVPEPWLRERFPTQK